MRTLVAGILLLSLTLSVFGKEDRLFAITNPDMGVVKLFNHQLAWQLKQVDNSNMAKCIRGEARAWFGRRSSMYRQRYKRLSRISSIEVIKFNNKTNLVLLNDGCETFTVIFRLEFRKYKNELNMIKSPYIRAVQALKLVNQYSRVRIPTVDRIVQHINHFLTVDNIPNYGEWVNISPLEKTLTLPLEFSILKSGLIADSGRLKGQPKFAYVEFALSLGPL
ncbi:hypothetical protein MNBD_GAMMA12-2407 [hydrothermal vent metagenome]|uniref:Uncharacterized protein n=1 Tax=hydrothermal vent metagenome TaxID=652676 RepID=A0A3B0YIQ1_9ZZZZ